MFIDVNFLYMFQVSFELQRLFGYVGSLYVEVVYALFRSVELMANKRTLWVSK